MDYTKEENFAYARNFLKEGDEKNALGHYALLNEKDPENAEADFFSTYYAYKLFLSKRNDASLKNVVRVMDKKVEKAVKGVKESEGNEAEKIFVISKIVEYYTPIESFLIENDMASANDIIVSGVLGLYSLGDAIEDNFGSNVEAMKMACEAWKEAVKIHQKFYVGNYNGKKAMDYAEKIKKIEPNYVMPKKAGCISFV